MNLTQAGQKKYTVFVNAEMKIVFFFGFIIFIFDFILFIVDSGLEKRQVIVTFLNCCCRHSGGDPQSPDCWSSCNVFRKMREGEMDDDRSMVNEVEGVWNLVRREMLRCMREEISVCVELMLLIAVVGVAC